MRIRVLPASGAATRSASPVRSDAPAVHRATAAAPGVTAYPDFPIAVGFSPGLSPLLTGANHSAGLKNQSFC
ncbi:MAG: hypothetical protein PHW73_02760 [Atribacterota bacterium]|nr:hypothetical protein [Atribacterota bacterium]